MMRAVLLFFLTALVAACSLSQPYPKRATFAIEPGKPDHAAASTAPATANICLQGVRIAKPYDSQLFIYKTGKSEFIQDYYAGFISPPDKLFAAQLVDWLNDSGAVKYVITPGSLLPYSYILEVNITALYADYSDPRKPQAVFEFRAFLLTENPAMPRMLLQKLYHHAEPIAAPEPAQLVDGWNECYRQSLTDLAQDIVAAMHSTDDRHDNF